jgi:hypothetical protein
MTILATASRLFAPNAQSRIARALLLALLLGVAFQRAATAAAAGEDRGDPEKPVCLFLTGLGVKSSRVEFRGSYEAYWGELHDAVSEYCTPRFFKTDTSFRGWDDKALQAEYCAAIHATQARIIFTHSMGGLVVAAGIHNKLLGCDRIAKTTEVVTGKNVVWINVQSPFRGSEIADQCSQFCRTADEWEKSKSPFMMRVRRPVPTGLWPSRVARSRRTSSTATSPRPTGTPCWATTATASDAWATRATPT